MKNLIRATWREYRMYKILKVYKYICKRVQSVNPTLQHRTLFFYEDKTCPHHNNLLPRNLNSNGCRDASYSNEIEIIAETSKRCYIFFGYHNFNKCIEWIIFWSPYIAIANQTKPTLQHPTQISFIRIWDSENEY